MFRLVECAKSNFGGGAGEKCSMRALRQGVCIRKKNMLSIANDGAVEV